MAKLGNYFRINLTMHREISTDFNIRLFTVLLKNTLIYRY